MYFTKHISKVTKSTVECRLLSSEGVNNHKLLHFTENISKVTKSAIELLLLSSEGITNYKLLQFLLLTDKLLQFLLLTASFHLHPRIITFSTLKNDCGTLVLRINIENVMKLGFVLE
jgi:hypothetical protein